MSFLRDLLGSSPFPSNWKMPVEGTIVPLSDVPDPAFSQGALGPGFAIQPQGDVIVSPVDGVVTVLFHTLHAICLQSENGLEILLHIGIDTVKLNGRGFEPLVSQGDEVYAGQPLIKVDWEVIKAAQLSPIIPVVFTELTGKSVIVKNGRPVLG